VVVIYLMLLHAFRTFTALTKVVLSLRKLQFLDFICTTIPTSGQISRF